jgi:hypothetical protein
MHRGAIADVRRNAFLCGRFDELRNETVIAIPLYGWREADSRGPNPALNEIKGGSLRDGPVWSL